MNGPRRRRCKAGNRQCRRIGRERRRRGKDRLGSFGYLGLDLDIFEHGLDDEVGIGERPIVIGRQDAGEHRIGRLARHASLVDRLAENLDRISLALFGHRRIPVDQHDVDPGLRGNKRDSRAHHSGAQHPDFPHRRLFEALRSPRAFFGRLFRDETGADDVACDRIGQQARKIFGLDRERPVERQLHAFEHTGSNRDRRGVVISRLAGDSGGGHREKRRRFRAHHAARFGQRKALPVPRPLSLGATREPSARRFEQIGGRHHRFDHTQLQRLDWSHRPAAQQKVERGFDADDAEQSLRSSRTRQKADVDLGKADHCLGVIDQHPMVTGERQLEPAAET